METCRWTRYTNDNVFHTDCGNVQGVLVRPKQKKCYCGRKIERILLDELSQSEQYYKEILERGN